MTFNTCETSTCLLSSAPESNKSCSTVNTITIIVFRSDQLWKRRNIKDCCGSVTFDQIEAELSCLFNNYSVQAVCFSPSHACQQAKSREELGSVSKWLSGKMRSRPDLMQLQWRRKHTDQKRVGDRRKEEKEEGCVVSGQPVYRSALHLVLATYNKRKVRLYIFDHFAIQFVLFHANKLDRILSTRTRAWLTWLDFDWMWVTILSDNYSLQSIWTWSYG